MSKRKSKQSDERTEKKPRAEEKDAGLVTVSDHISHFQSILLPHYDQKNPNHVARLADLKSGDMRHFQNIVLGKLRMVVDPIKNPGKDAKKLYWIRLVNDLSNDSTMSILTCVAPVLWPKCGLTGDYKEGKYGGETLEKSKYKYGISATSWSSMDRNESNQSETSMEFMKFSTAFGAWLHEQIWQHPMLALRTKAAARDKATEEWEAKNTVLVECGKPALPFHEDLVKKAWFKYNARNPVRLTKDKDTKKDTPHTEHVELSRPVLRGLNKKEKQVKETRPTPYVGASDLFTESYYKNDKIENPIVFKNYKGAEIPREKMLTRPMQHGDVTMTHCQPQIFDDSPKDTNGVSFIACEVWMYQFAKPNSVRPSNIELEGGQDFPSGSPSSSSLATCESDVPIPNLLPVSPCDSDLMNFDADALHDSEEA